MSDLRERLVRRSERFDLEPGAIERVFDRRRKIQRRRRIMAGALALAFGAAGTIVVLTAFHGDGQQPADHGSPTPIALPSIPDGTYWSPPVTRGQLLASMIGAGFTRREAKRYYFDALSIPIDPWIRQGLVIQDGFWFQTARDASGHQEAGWGGNFRVIGPNIVQAAATDCTITYRFTLSGSSLTLHVLRDVGQSDVCRSEDRVAQTAIYDPAPFVLEPSLSPSQPAG
jgi:hypothetical protein